MIPFAIAITIMGTRELWLNVVQPWQHRRRINGNGNSDVSGDNGANGGQGNSNSDDPPDEAASPRAAKSPVAQD
jgi:hypothetical protein